MDIQFLQIVLPTNSGWFYVVRMPEPGSSDDKPRHTAVRVDQPHRGSYVINKYNADHGIFFTPFTFDIDYVDADNGHKKNVRRLDQHKIECKCVWIDLDIGKEKGKYPDKETALKAVLNACDDHSMPKPTVITDSGGGLHCYWVFNQALPLPRWQGAAERFKQFWIDAGVKFDHKCTADSARIMRLPGSNNMKTGSPRPCRRLDYDGPLTSVGFIDRWPEAKAVSSLETIHSLFSDGGEHLTDVEYGPKYTAEIVKQCNIFKLIATDHGASCSEPLWKDMLQTVKMTADCEEWAHKLSDGHSGYSYESTEAKLAERTLGKGILCAAFAEHYEEHVCAGCPLEGKGHSPLKYGTKVEDPLPYQPHGLIIKGSGTYLIVAGEKKKDPPVEKLIARSQIQSVEALQEETFKGLHPFLRVTHATGGVVHSRLLDMHKLSRSSDGQMAMNSIGLSIPSSDGYKLMGEVLNSWYSKLTAAGHVTHLNRVQGWQKIGHTITGFVLGDKIYNADGTLEDSGSHADDETALTYTPVGELAPWQVAANSIIGSGNPALVTMIAISLGAPLGALMGTSGYCASVSYYSKDSGVGKSTTLRVARAVWASPNSFAVLDDTYNGVMATLKRAPHLPLMWDDPRKQKTRADLREMLFQIAAGRTKQRSNPDGTPAEVVHMHTIGMVASNDPLLGELSSATGEAEAKRVLEIRVPRVTLNTPDRVFSALDDNYGRAGAMMVEYIAAHIPKVQKQLQEVKSLVQTRLGHDNSDRFYVNTITVSVVAAAIATKLGIVEFDVGHLLNAFVQIVEDTRRVAKQTSLDNTATNDVLSFIAADNVYGGIVKKFRKGGRGGDDDVLRRPYDPLRPWHYVIEDSSGVVRFSNNRFAEWYYRKHDHPLNLAGWQDRAEAEGILVKRSTQVSLAIGNLTFTGHDKLRCTVVQIMDLIGAGSHSLQVVGGTDVSPSDDDASVES